MVPIQNKRGFTSLSVLIYSILLISMVFILFSTWKLFLNQSDQGLERKSETLHNRTAIQRNLLQLESNLSVVKDTHYSDIERTVKLETVSTSLSSIPLTKTVDGVNQRTYTFPVYSNDDLSVTFTNMPMDTTINLSNDAGTFSKTYTDTNISELGSVFYQTTDDYNVNQYGTFTLDITSPNDLSSLTTTLSSYTSERVLWLKTLIQGEVVLQRKVRVQNTLDGINTINLFY